MEFNEFKKEILRRAKEANACADEYRRAYRSNDYSELIQVIKDNFNFAVIRKVIDPSLIEAYKDEFNANQIYCNVDVTSGFLLAWGNATVKAWGNATVEASDNATVKAWGNATVKASVNATVEASDNAYTTSYCIIECKLSGDAIYRIRESNTIRYASDNIRFEKVKTSSGSL
jgi:hypothetical protein